MIINVRRGASSRLRLVRTEVQERRDAGRAEGEVSNRGNRERRGAEQSTGQPEEFSEARIEGEGRLLDVVRRRIDELVEPREERAKPDEDRHIGGTQDVGG